MIQRQQVAIRGGTVTAEGDSAIGENPSLQVDDRRQLGRENFEPQLPPEKELA